MSINEDLGKCDAITNIVFMGMGEPLDNLGPVVDSLRLMTAPEAMRISTRKVTVSTSGLVDKIKDFQKENIHINLAISLNATDDKIRDQLMPINKKYPIKTLMNCLRNYPLKPQWLKGIPCKINLIPFNSLESTEYRPPPETQTFKFQDYLIAQNFSAFVRQNRATDILGACGQLATQSKNLSFV